MMQPIPKGFRPWIIVSLTILVGSLVLLAADIIAAFVYFSRATPLWVTVVGGFAMFGVLLGFAGFLLLMFVAGWLAFRESRKVQVLPPEQTQDAAR